MKYIARYISMPLLCALAVCSCNIYRSYERPESIRTEDNLFRDTVPSGDTLTIASLPWNELFTDPMLGALIDTGLVNNTDLRVAMLKTDEAEAMLMASRLSYLPSVEFSPQVSTGSFNGSEASFSYSVGGSASWEIDIFGKLRNEMKSSESVLQQNRAYVQAVRTKLISTIAGSYYTLLMLDEQLSISKETAENWGNYVSTLRALKDFGTVKESDIAQAEANRLKVESSVFSIEQQIVSVENSLSVLLGKEPGPIERGTLDGQCFPDSLSTGVPLQLLRNRPDVIQAEWALAQAFYTTNKARASFYPSITIGGTAGWTNSAGTAIVNPAAWLLNAVGSLVQPLFNRGQNIAQLKVSKAQQEEALLLFQQSILDAGAEVNDALVQWQTSRKRLDYDKRQISYLESAVSNTELLMTYGTVNYLEVLTAQQNLLQARLTEAEDKFNEIQSVINLYHALGGGSDFE